MVYGSIATIDEQLQEIEGDIRRFNEDDWKTVVPSIRDDAKQIRKLLDELKDRLEPIELPPDHDGPE